MSDQAQDLTIRVKLDKSQAVRERAAFNADMERLDRQLLGDEKTRENARRAMFSETHATRAKAAKDAAAAEKTGLDALASGAESALASVKGLAAGYVGLQGAQRVVSLIADAWKEAADQAERAAKGALEFERHSRMSGVLRGVTPDQQAAQTLDLMIKSGLGQAETDNLVRQFEGSLPIGIEKGNISRETADALLRQVAITQARQGGDAGTRGDLAGILAQFGKVESVEAGMGQLEAIRQALSAGRGDDPVLTSSLLHVAGGMVREGGPVGTLPELAALVGTMSLSAGPMQADSRTEQLLRALRGTDKNQMQKIAEQFGIPVGSQMGLEERLSHVIPKLREVGKTTDVQSWLTMNVGTTQEDSRALLELMPNYEAFRSRLDAARKASGQGAAAMQADSTFQQTPLGRAMAAESSQEAGRYVFGSRYKEAESLIAESQAIEAARPDSWGKYLENKAAAITGQGSSAERNLRIRLQQLGAMNHLDLQGDTSTSFPTPLSNIQSMVDELRRAGVDPMQVNRPQLQQGIEDPVRKMSEAADTMKAAAESMEKSSGASAGVGWGTPAPPPLNGKPVPHPPSVGAGW